jgi:hypothetical protein
LSLTWALGSCDRQESIRQYFHAQELHLIWVLATLPTLFAVYYLFEDLTAPTRQALARV